MPYEIKGLNEECGVFGIYNVPDAANVTYFGLHALQHRGQQGAGIVASDGQKLRQFRDRGLLSEVFSNPADLDFLKGNMAIGHVRYGTAGSDSLANVQPFLFHFQDGEIALCHNGNLTNAKTLKKRLEDSGSVFQSSSDTEVLIHLIRRKVRMPFIEALKASLNEVKGGFAFLLMTNDTLYAALDPNGFRPLVLGQMDNGSYVVASESCALDAVHAKLVRDVQPGELIIINKDGIKIDHYTTETQLAVCSMEYIYFARPDSIIHGVNIHTARKRMGILLAKEQPAPEEADMVIGVPNSSLSAATGYAEAAGLPYEMGLIKNQYIARTFIQPTQALREQGVKMKLAPVRGVVSGKNIVVVDDSIVRGTTSRQIVQMLKEAGAKVWTLPEKNGHPDLNVLMQRLGEEKIDSVLIEGGGTVNEAALKAHIVHHVYAYIAPKIFGGEDAKTPVEGSGIRLPQECANLRLAKITVLLNDMLLEYDVEGETECSPE